MFTYTQFVASCLTVCFAGGGAIALHDVNDPAELDKNMIQAEINAIEAYDIINFEAFHLFQRDGDKMAELFEKERLDLGITAMEESIERAKSLTNRAKTLEDKSKNIEERKSELKDRLKEELEEIENEKKGLLNEALGMLDIVLAKFDSKINSKNTICKDVEELSEKDIKIFKNENSNDGEILLEACISR